MKWLLLLIISTAGIDTNYYGIYETEGLCKDAGIYEELSREEENLSWGCFEVNQLDDQSEVGGYWGDMDIKIIDSDV